MPEFQIIPSLSVTPSRCVFCGSHEGPFVVTREQTWIEGFGLVAVCASNTEDKAGCLVQAARLAGCVDLPVAEKAQRQADYWHDAHTLLAEETAPLRELSDLVAKIHGDAGDGPRNPAEARGEDVQVEGAAGPAGSGSGGGTLEEHLAGAEQRG